MKSSVGNFLLKRPAAGALSSLMLVTLLASGSAWANSQSQDDDASRQGECELNDQQQAMLSKINEARSQARQCGDQQFEAAEPLTWSCKLEAAAKSHSQDMAENDYFSHTDPDGAGIEQRVGNQDYVWQAVGENIAAGLTSVSAVVEGWLDSPGHCQNIMNDAFTEMGMAKAEDSESRYSSYWTQTLGHPR
ncbi:CAP domain-containing protein [Halomonas sp. ISL-60]|uniref:CAP domain-containing protein n=1 Tax=Halomonas sp. ISL-56 TaxID=2819149 RepID=UPI001BE88608|nr:CAP domain-containing protein [Halomonas sp. ISL-56]MBT2774417.1 CAP domain-containing protein [Halomonas sp. ISL-60]MBT2802364.1 CAP domain-containing protein [Halomonas sp. ISL-56]